MQFYSKVVLLVIAITAVLMCRVQSRSSGPPADEAINRLRVCNDMLPSHPGNPAAQNGNGGYTISTNLPRISDTEYAYTADQTYTLTVSGSTMFQGFLVIAHVPDQRLMLLGGFTTGGPNQQIIEECDTVGANTQAAIGHSNRISATSTTFSWIAPSGPDGTVDFRFTVVQSLSIFFVAQSAAQTSLEAIVDPTAPVPTIEPPVPPTPPVRDPEDYRLTFRTPPNCLLDECNVFVGIDTNVGSSAYLDITMQGVAGGWLAVGFTFTRSMFDADVVGCIRDPTNDNVTAIDTWNEVDVRNNTRDDTQDITLFNSSFVNGTISCTFSRLITGSDPAPQDRNLDNNYFILYGYRGMDNPDNDTMSFPVHVDAVPVSSPMMINPVNGNNQPFNGVTIPMRDPEDYRLTFRTPDGCNVTNCTSFVGIDTNTGNPGILDIYMEGEAQGWVAVGFTETRSMFDADVVGCNRNPDTNMIEALDTYNIPAPDRNNSVDVRQNVLLFNSSFDGTRIICTVGKQIAPSDPNPQDVNLNSNLYTLWGIRAMDSAAGMLLTHGANVPAASPQQVNPAAIIDGPGLSAPVRNPADYRLIFSSPADCVPSACDIFVGIDNNTGNSSFLDIYMEGNSQGWVAVGFSDTRNMMAADVVGCNRDPNNNDMVEVVDTWNLNQGRGNTLDAIQDVRLFTSNFDNGRISCTVAKQIIASGSNEDISLNTGLFVMYGVGPTGTGAQALAIHNTGAGNPLLSEQRVNPALDAGNLANDFPMPQLLRAHGILMLIAWPLLAVSGIFFAAWMRPALPNGEWFQIHRAFLLSSLFVGAVGFMLAFIAHARNPTPGLINFTGNPTGTAHYVIGVIVMFLHILNPIISACRCHPGDKYRWIFNLVHGTTIGLLVEILALTNIALGLERFGPSSFFVNSNPLTIFWVYIGYLIFFLVMIGVLFLVFTLLSFFSQDEDRSKTAPSLIKPMIGSGPDSGHKPVPTNEGVELAVPGQKPTFQSGNDSGKPKVPSKDSPLRWGALTIFLVVNVVMMLVLIILIAIE